MRDDQRQGVGLFRTDVNEVNVDSIDVGDELREGIELGLDLAPVAVVLSVAREFVKGGELDALRLVGDELRLWPACGCDAVAQVGERFFGKVDAEGADADIAPGLLFHGFLHHGALLYLRHSTQPYYTADRFRVGLTLCYNQCLKK